MPASTLSSRTLLATGLSTAVALLAACSSSGGVTASNDGPAGVTEQLGHIHSLDVDPSDGTLFVASHQGLFSFGADGYERVGEGRFDAMSFTIAGADRFLLSGHPEQGTAGPAHLGLAESTDAGRTWTSLSLAGEADFHALEAAGNRVYGVDSQTGRLMLTEDGERWTDLGQLPAVDVAADPDNPGEVLLTDGRGTVARLEDAGPQPLESAPRLVLLDWVSEELLVGAGPDGSVHRSDDGGESWAEVGALPSAPYALTATSATWFAATEEGVLESEDAGRTWSELEDR